MSVSPRRSFLSEYDRSYPLAAYPRRLEREGQSLVAYLALLRLGFTVPFVLPRTRWALTPPFHPYLQAKELPEGGLFSVALAVTRYESSGRTSGFQRVPRCYLAVCPWSPDFPRQHYNTAATVQSATASTPEKYNQTITPANQK